MASAIASLVYGGLLGAFALGVLTRKPGQVEAIVGQAGGKAEALLLENCGHAPHRDRPETTFKAMRDFILELKQ